jgi:hypothetical protein
LVFAIEALVFAMPVDSYLVLFGSAWGNNFDAIFSNFAIERMLYNFYSIFSNFVSVIGCDS